MSAAAQRVMEPTPQPLPFQPEPQIAPPKPPRHSIEEYLDLERRSPVRHEYLDGEIRAMAGTMPEHNLVAGNLYRGLGNRFEDRNCTAYISDIRVAVTDIRYRYPDVVAVCGDTVFNDQRPPALLNPMVIVEVLSDSTEESDRTDKFLEYRAIASVTDYVLISQERIQVIHFARKSATQWTVDEYTELEQTLSLAALEVEISLAEIYRKVTFPAAPP